MDMSVEVSPNEYTLHDLQSVILSVDYPNFAICKFLVVICDDNT